MRTDYFARESGSISALSQNRSILRARWLSVLLVSLFPGRSFGLAEFKTDYTFPVALANLQNAIVRVDETEKSGDNFVGTGTIFKITPDGNGGNFYDILTADHVVRDGGTDGLPTTVLVGFGTAPKPNTDANLAVNFPIAVNSVAQNVAYDNPVDLAVFAIDVPGTVPQGVLPANKITPVTIGAANKATAKGQLIMAGDGFQGTPTTYTDPGNNNFDAYQIGSTFGTLLVATTNTYYTGTNATFTTPSASGNFKYKFQSLDDSFVLTPAGSGAKATSGSAYSVEGDSGGPTFQSDGNGGLIEVGVHSASDTATTQLTKVTYAIVDNTTPYLDHDVDLSPAAVQTFITNSTTSVNVVPEPSAAIASVSLAALMALRRRSRNGSVSNAP